ncbi:MAG: hypothetical protein ACM3O8_04025 [Methylococcaceae bacterium]|nr:hypothetical protein [Prolixibacteraceae bacterium]
MQFRFNYTTLVLVIINSILMGYILASADFNHLSKNENSIVLFFVAFFGLGITILKSRVRTIKLPQKK